MTLLEDLSSIYETRAQGRYGLAHVNQLQHGLQAATLAEAAGEGAAMITAALLHDIGHMVHDLGDNPAADGVDDHHEDRSAEWLARFFPQEVTEPVRLHVAAKRYLVATDPTYGSRLAPDSIETLKLQGGPMSADEVAEFDSLPFAEAAKRLRRFDEAAKDANAVTEPFDYFLKYVEICRI